MYMHYVQVVTCAGCDMCMHYVQVVTCIYHVQVVRAEIFKGNGPRSNRREMALGSTQPLECKADLIQVPAGFQANFCLQCIPATPVTAIAFRPSWGL